MSFDSAMTALLSIVGFILRLRLVFQWPISTGKLKKQNWANKSSFQPFKLQIVAWTVRSLPRHIRHIIRAILHDSKTERGSRDDKCAN